MFKQMITTIKYFLIFTLLSISLGGCVSMNPSSEVNGQQAAADNESIQQDKQTDPFEKFNRSMYKFNAKLDKYIAKPVAKGYVKYVPKPVRKGVSNVFSNLWEPNTAVNSLLQGKGRKAADSGARFILNSTVGILGVFDVATALGVSKHHEDVGQTLAVWGVGDGPFLMLPFLGPSNVRDFSGRIIQFSTTDLVPYLFDGSEALLPNGLRLIDDRVDLLGADDILALQVDPYTFLRESYRQSRKLAIADGQLVEEEDSFEADLFE